MRTTGRFPTSIFSLHHLEPGQRLTLVMLYAMSEPEQLVVWTGARDMAIESGYAHRGMQEHIRRLVKAGHITRITRPDPRKRAHFSGFRLTMGLDGLPDGAQSDELET